jgi:hypothetical protein
LQVIESVSRLAYRDNRDIGCFSLSGWVIGHVLRDRDEETEDRQRWNIGCLEELRVV